MSNNIVEELPARKHAPIAVAPVKKASEPAKVGQSVPKGGDSEEASAKRIRQAVYDIRYRAKKDKITLQAAYNSYMGNSNLNAKEKKIVKERLFGKEGGGVKEQFSVGADEWAIDNITAALHEIFTESDEIEQLAYLKQLDEEDEKKYKVRVTDMNGKSYIRLATRKKITELRANANIKSVEMTEHGDIVGGERSKGEKTAAAKGGGGIGTALGETSPLDEVFKTAVTFSVGAGTSLTIDVDDVNCGNVAMIKPGTVHVAVGATFHIAPSTILKTNVLGLFN